METRKAGDEKRTDFNAKAQSGGRQAPAAGNWWDRMKEPASGKAKSASSNLRRRAEAKAKAAQSEAQRLAVLERFHALPEAERDGLLAAFLATDAQARAWYKKKGFDAPFFLFPFVHFLKEGRLHA